MIAERIDGTVRDYRGTVGLLWPSRELWQVEHDADSAWQSFTKAMNVARRNGHTVEQIQKAAEILGIEVKP